MHTRLLLLAASTICAVAAAQANAVTGLDGRLYDIDSPTVWGRRGVAYPNGEVGFSAANYMCNSGSVLIPWRAAMQEDHPKFGFMVVRVNNDRMVQISDRSFCKHAFVSINGSAGPCLPCQNPGNGAVMGIGCYDVYGAGNNGDRFWLGPADEIDPWLGTWAAVASYFDRGDPDVGPPGNSDGIRSNIAASDMVKNRVTIQEQDLVVPGAQFFYQIHLLHQGEPVANRNNNIQSRGVNYTWNGSAWAATNVGAATTGSVLTRWNGAAVSLAGNGTDDGRVAVAVKVTALPGGMWHYEYAVHNVDNNRGLSAFRLPICTAARVQNIGFRDIDGNALNQWTAQVGGGEIAWTAPSTNPMNWNMLFNFWFDSDSPPVAGAAAFDAARIGPGALQFNVATSTPGIVPNVHLGDGCGSPAPELRANGVAASPNPSFAMQVTTTPFNLVFFFFSTNAQTTPMGNGCNAHLDLGQTGTYGLLVSDATGTVTIPFPIPAGLRSSRANFQAAVLETGGPLFGDFALTNGLGVRINPVGCP